MRTRLTISFLTEDHDLIEHLQSVREQGQNLSSYIRNLIRNDMNEAIPNNSVDALAQAIAEKLGTVQIVTNAEKPTGDESVDFETKMIIDQLF